jgi:hypothetical protein
MTSNLKQGPEGINLNETLALAHVASFKGTSLKILAVKFNM